MAEWVLDSSAVLASARGEQGGDVAEDAFGGALICTVNLAEVATRLGDTGVSMQRIRTVIEAGGFATVDFDPELAYRTAALRPTTRHLGLSLGDRACLALAEREGLPVLTADRAWASLDIGIEIRLIR